MYAYLKNISKVEETLKRRLPESVKNTQHEMQPHAQTTILTSDAASYDRERGAATESAAREYIDLENLIMIVPAQFDRAFG